MATRNSVFSLNTRFMTLVSRLLGLFRPNLSTINVGLPKIANKMAESQSKLNILCKMRPLLRESVRGGGGPWNFQNTGGGGGSLDIPPLAITGEK